jgi:hypothetical protein
MVEKPLRFLLLLSLDRLFVELLVEVLLRIENIGSSMKPAFLVDFVCDSGEDGMIDLNFFFNNRITGRRSS